MTPLIRPSQRLPDELRKIVITTKYTKHAEGSVLVEFGDTKVICTASVEDSVPRFLKGTGQGWITAEYGMLPRIILEFTDYCEPTKVHCDWPAFTLKCQYLIIGHSA